MQFSRVRSNIITFKPPIICLFGLFLLFLPSLCKPCVVYFKGKLGIRQRAQRAARDAQRSALIHIPHFQCETVCASHLHGNIHTCMYARPQPTKLNFIFLPQTSPHLYGALPTKSTQLYLPSMNLVHRTLAHAHIRCY